MTTPEEARTTSGSERLLVLVSGGRDAALTCDLLVRARLEAYVCHDVTELCEELARGAAGALLDEQVLTARALLELTAALGRQPPWSDFPVVVFGASSSGGREMDDRVRLLGNVTFLERPVRARSMLAAARAAIRSRLRQYEGRRAIEVRDTFLAMLGHELRNPLAAIRLAVSMNERKNAATETSREDLVIEQQTKNLTRIVDDLLDVARITQGKIKLSMAAIDVVEAARRAFEAHDATARARGHRIRFVSPLSPILVKGDRERLEQVFANLITNAIKYTREGGEITVSVESKDGEAHVAVSDTGVGISAEMLPRVFEVFAQAERTLDRTQGGLGLGLAVVRSVVDLHGGTVSASSDGPGRGSTFVVRLKVARADTPADPVSSHRISHGAPALRVLVVEDNDDIRDLFVELLRDEGHEVTSAADGPDGLDAVLGSAPDLAFVDLGLPGIDGLALARRARAAGSKTHLVAVTGYGQAEDRTHALEAGFDDHLTKPVRDSDLQRVLSAIKAS